MSHNRVDPRLVARAVQALKTHDERAHAKKRQLIDRASSVNVTMTLKADNEGNTAIYQEVQRPVRVPIPHSTYNEDEDSTCLFVRTEDLAQVKEMMEESKIHVAEVISMSQVRKEYERFAAKKGLLNSHTHFFCDERITPYLYNSLGKVFLGKNKHPVPIRYGSLEALPAALRKAQGSSFMHLKGVNISFKAGYTDTNEEHLVENIVEGLENAANKINGKWASIQSVHVKTPESFAIPLFSASDDPTLERFKQLHAEEQKTTGAKRPKEDTKEEAPAHKETPAKRAKQETKAETPRPLSASKPAKQQEQAKPETPAAGKRKQQAEETKEASAKKPTSTPATPASGKKATQAPTEQPQVAKTPATGKKANQQREQQIEEVTSTATTPSTGKKTKQQQQEQADQKGVKGTPASGSKAKPQAAEQVEETKAATKTPATGKKAKQQQQLEEVEAVTKTPSTGKKNKTQEVVQEDEEEAEPQEVVIPVVSTPAANKRAKQQDQKEQPEEIPKTPATGRRGKPQQPAEVEEQEPVEETAEVAMPRKTPARRAKQQSEDADIPPTPATARRSKRQQEQKEHAAEEVVSAPKATPAKSVKHQEEPEDEEEAEDLPKATPARPKRARPVASVTDTPATRTRTGGAASAVKEVGFTPSMKKRRTATPGK